jgi:hypothetical protein
MTLTFHDNGTATGLWGEDIPLGGLGELSVRRASTIEFNDISQEWEVRLIDPTTQLPGEVMFSNASRQACITWEHKYFEDAA